MAGLNPPLERSTGPRRVASAAISLPRIVMSWEDWLTFAGVLVAFLSVAVSIQQANWVEDMPKIWPTSLAGLTVGLVAARVRWNALAIQPFALALGVLVVVVAVQNSADGVTFQDRVADFWSRMRDWWTVVRNGDISNDDLPFVTLVHGSTFLAAYFASWSIYRWHNPWLALVPGGFILLSNISFLSGKPSGAFIAFLFGALFLVARVHLQRSQARWKAGRVEYPDFISLSTLGLTFWLSLALVITAWQVPLAAQARAVEGVFDGLIRPVQPLSDDFTRLFHNVDSRTGVELHNFGATLPIQGHVRLGTKLLFEVTSGQPGLVRGASYDEYTGAGWKATNRQRAELEGGALPQGLTQYKQRAETILRVEVKGGESTVLSLGVPIGTNLNSFFSLPRGAPPDVERIRSERSLTNGDTYNSIGSISTATAQQLQEAGTAYPDWIRQRYLQLPSDMPSRVRQEAIRVTQGAATPYDRSVAIERYLRSFPYDLAVPAAPPGRDAVDYLLFDLKRGYFDYQATAMAVMLRTLNIPARIAIGYALDPGTALDQKYTIRKNDAYAWVEVFFPGYGWVNFNPTSDRPAGGANGFGSAGYGAATVSEPVADASLDSAFGDLASGTEFPEVEEALAETPVDQTDPPWTWIWTLAGVLALAAAMAVLGRISWNWGLGSLDGRAALWAKTQRLGAWVGLGGRPQETPREWSRRLGSAIERPEQAATLAEAYQEARYGRPDLQRIATDDASGAYRGLRSALLAKLLRWKGKGARPS